MTGNRDLLSNLQYFRGPIVSFRDSAQGQIKGAGCVTNGVFKIDDVSLVEELKYNLISVSQLCDKGYIVTFLKDCCQIASKKDNLLLFTGMRKGNMYLLDMRDASKTGGKEVCFIAKATTDESVLWHRRFAHLNFKSLNQLAQMELVRGLPQKEYINEHQCSACMMGKQTHESHKPKVENSIMAPLHLLHMDLFGPISIQSLSKKRYTLVVVDDYSRFTWTFFLHSKDETAENLMSFIDMIETRNASKVRCIRSDQGTEF